MTAQNPSMHARSAADAMERLVRDVKSGRAEWSHPQLARQAVDDLTRLLDAGATALQQIAAAYSEQVPSNPQNTQTVTSLHQAGQHTTTAATQLRQARRTMH